MGISAEPKLREQSLSELSKDYRDRETVQDNHVQGLKALKTALESIFF